MTRLALSSPPSLFSSQVEDASLGPLQPGLEGIVEEEEAGGAAPFLVRGADGRRGIREALHPS